MAVNGSRPVSAAPTSTSGDSAIDVHAHAMPLPLLTRLGERGLADLAGVPEGIVRLDPRVSGVGPRARLPLARSQYDVQVRLSEMDEIGVDRHAVSLPPFLFCSTVDDRGLASDIVAAGNDELATYVSDAPENLVGLGSVPLGWPDAAEEARRALDQLGMAGIAIGSRGGGRDLDDQSTTSCGPCCRSGGRSCSCTPAVCRIRTGRPTSGCRSSSAARWRRPWRWPGWCSAGCWSASR